MIIYLVLSCWIDLTDPEPNVTIQGVFSTEELAKKHANELIDEDSGSWIGIRECILDDPNDGISLDKDDVDMELFY